MVTRKAFLQITEAIILGLRNSLADPPVHLKQTIMKELAEILGVKRGLSAVVSGYTKRLRENMETTLTYLEIIHREAGEINKALQKN
jgi:hypothetical protein